MTKSRFAAARHASDARERAEGNFCRHVFQVVALRAHYLERPALRQLAAFRRHLHGHLAREIFARQRPGVRENLRRRALCDDLAAMDAGAGADIEDVIGLQDRVFVMLDDDHGVAKVAQALQGHEKAFVVALMQADRRLVEHVQHARQPGADLAREPDALAFAAG